jgi:hypothetical protein
VITDASWRHALIGACGGDIGLGDTEPDDRGGEVTSCCDARGSERLKDHVRAAAGGVAIWHIFRRLRPENTFGPDVGPDGVARDFNKPSAQKPAYRNRASPDLDWDLDKQ